LLYNQQIYPLCKKSIDDIKKIVEKDHKNSLIENRNNLL